MFSYCASHSAPASATVRRSCSFPRVILRFSRSAVGVLIFADVKLYVSITKLLASRLLKIPPRNSVLRANAVVAIRHWQACNRYPDFELKAFALIINLRDYNQRNMWIIHNEIGAHPSPYAYANCQPEGTSLSPSTTLSRLKLVSSTRDKCECGRDATFHKISLEGIKAKCITAVTPPNTG